ncbi:MAG: hypothetical protein KF819_32495 [Labilithrix sp.]|nr:hypothetical protein [Labilithrix sp.]
MTVVQRRYFVETPGPDGSDHRVLTRVTFTEKELYGELWNVVDRAWYYVRSADQVLLDQSYVREITEEEALRIADEKVAEYRAEKKRR